MSRFLWFVVSKAVGPDPSGTLLGHTKKWQLCGAGIGGWMRGRSVKANPGNRRSTWCIFWVKKNGKWSIGVRQTLTELEGDERAELRSWHSLQVDTPWQMQVVCEILEQWPHQPHERMVCLVILGKEQNRGFVGIDMKVCETPFISFLWTRGWAQAFCASRWCHRQSATDLKNCVMRWAPHRHWEVARSYSVLWVQNPVLCSLNG